MKKILVCLLAAALTACATTPYYEGAKQNDFSQANYDATDKLMSSIVSVPIDKNTPILVATMVNIDSLTQSSRFGRLVSEQLSTRLTQLGYHVVEMKMRSDVYVREGTGELLLSRDVQKLTKNYNAQLVLVGNYAVTNDYAYLTLKAVTAADNRVVSAVNYLQPVTGNNCGLLTAQ